MEAESVFLDKALFEIQAYAFETCKSYAGLNPLLKKRDLSVSTTLGVMLVVLQVFDARIKVCGGRNRVAI